MADKEKHCPCKRIKCERHGDCNACVNHHHNSEKMPDTSCERMRKKEEKKKMRPN